MKTSNPFRPADETGEGSSRDELADRFRDLCHSPFAALPDRGRVALSSSNIHTASLSSDGWFDALPAGSYS